MSSPRWPISSYTPTGVATNGIIDQLRVDGENFLDGAALYLGDTSLMGVVYKGSTLMYSNSVPNTLYQTPGRLNVYVENTPGDASTRSNVVYLDVTGVAGEPRVVDYSPDNGVRGTTVKIIGSNFEDGMHINDALGNLVVAGTVSSITYLGGTYQTATFTVPMGFVTGPLKVTSSKGSYTGKTFTVGTNLTTGATLSASSYYSGRPVANGGDNNLETSWFAANGDCASQSAPACTTKPWYQVQLSAFQEVGRIAFRGNREYASGYNFLQGRFEVYNATGALAWGQSFSMPSPDHDLDVTFPTVIVSKVKFISEADESTEPGFAEIELFFN